MTNPVQEKQVEFGALSPADIGARVRLTRPIEWTDIQIEHRGILANFDETSITLTENEDRILPDGRFESRINCGTISFDLPRNTLIKVSPGRRK